MVQPARVFSDWREEVPGSAEYTSRVCPGSAETCRDSNARVSSPTRGWWISFTPCGGTSVVVRGPSGPELLATGGQLADEVGQMPVVGVAAGGRAN